MSEDGSTRIEWCGPSARGGDPGEGHLGPSNYRDDDSANDGVRAAGVAGIVTRSSATRARSSNIVWLTDLDSGS